MGTTAVVPITFFEPQTGRQTCGTSKKHRVRNDQSPGDLHPHFDLKKLQKKILMVKVDAVVATAVVPITFFEPQTGRQTCGTTKKHRVRNDQSPGDLHPHFDLQKIAKKKILMGTTAVASTASTFSKNIFFWRSKCGCKSPGDWSFLTLCFFVVPHVCRPVCGSKNVMGKWMQWWPPRWFPSHFVSHRLADKHAAPQKNTESEMTNPPGICTHILISV